MKRFHGDRTQAGAEVWVDNKPLPNRADLKQLSRDGLFEWSYVGNEPAQLALALLAHHLGDDTKALSLCDAFMRRIIANLDNDWELTAADIDRAIAKIDGGSKP